VVSTAHAHHNCVADKVVTVVTPRAVGADRSY